MGFPERLVRILDSTRDRGECKYCGKPIEWGISAPHGKFVPLNPAPFILHVETNETTGVRFLVISADALHFSSCKQRPPKPKKPRPPATAPYSPRYRP